MKDNGVYNISLGIGQERQLVSAFLDVRSDFMEEQSMKKQVFFDGGPINQEWIKNNISKQYDITNELNRRYLESARAILTDYQFEDFNKFINLKLEISQLHKQDGIYISVAPLWGIE